MPWVEKQAQLENSSPWGSSGRGDTVPLLSLPRPRGQAGHWDAPGKPRDGGSRRQLPGSHQTPAAHPVLWAGMGQWVPALQPPLGRGQLRSQSSCCARARDNVGNYGTAVKYKLEKNHLWRRGQRVSEPWGARGWAAPAPCRWELPSGPLAWLFALPLFLGLHERER